MVFISCVHSGFYIRNDDTELICTQQANMRIAVQDGHGNKRNIGGRNKFISKFTFSHALVCLPDKQISPKVQHEQPWKKSAAQMCTELGFDNTAEEDISEIDYSVLSSPKENLSTIECWGQTL